ncbi:MAG: NUDIX hydrolase [Bifidobacteriaceae bacterium]|jgi:8-oxo-dGTP pyrophosphatase MutT (NUDIX family)|nr:NUDIX hydrolase [Bifidobacteriaceae bacterium]
MVPNPSRNRLELPPAQVDRLSESFLNSENRPPLSDRKRQKIRNSLFPANVSLEARPLTDSPQTAESIVQSSETNEVEVYEIFRKDVDQLKSKLKRPFLPSDYVRQYSAFRLQRVDSNDHYDGDAHEYYEEVEEHSAGGIVVDNDRAVVIARQNRRGTLDWCLPKGHLEAGESPAKAAMREISEETGIVARVRRLLGVIDYYFVVGEYRIHKVVHHYVLRRIGGMFSVREDPDAEVARILWVPVSKLQTTLTYPNERRISHMLNLR